MTAHLKPFIQPPGCSEVFAVLGLRFTFLATGEQTGGTCAMVLAEHPPGDPGPPPHTHTREDEHFYVLSGSMTFEVGDRTYDAAAGTLVVAPRGIRHTLRNNGGEPARVLLLITPAGFENFFRTVGTPWSSRSDMPPPPSEADIRKVLETAPQFGLIIQAP